MLFSPNGQVVILPAAGCRKDRGLGVCVRMSIRLVGVSPFHCIYNYHRLRVTNSGGSHYAMIWVASAYTAHLHMNAPRFPHTHTCWHTFISPPTHARTQTWHLHIKALMCSPHVYTAHTHSSLFIHARHTCGLLINLDTSVRRPSPADRDMNPI